MHNHVHTCHKHCIWREATWPQQPATLSSPTSLQRASVASCLLRVARILMALLTSATAQKDTDRQPHRGSSQARVIDVYHRQRNTKDAETAQRACVTEKSGWARQPASLPPMVVCLLGSFGGFLWFDNRNIRFALSGPFHSTIASHSQRSASLVAPFSPLFLLTTPDYT